MPNYGLKLSFTYLYKTEKNLIHFKKKKDFSQGLMGQRINKQSTWITWLAGITCFEAYGIFLYWHNIEKKKRTFARTPNFQVFISKESPQRVSSTVKTQKEDNFIPHTDLCWFLQSILHQDNYIFRNKNNNSHTKGVPLLVMEEIIPEMHCLFRC